MKKLFYFNEKTQTWNMMEYSSRVKLAQMYAMQERNKVSHFVIGETGFECGSNGPTLSFLTKGKDPVWRSRQFNNPIECVIAWRNLCQKGYARRIKFANIPEKEYKAGTTNTDAVPMPREVRLLAKEAEQAQTKPQTETVQDTEIVGKHAAKTESAETIVRTATRRTGRLQRRQAAQQTNAQAAAEAQAAMAILSAPMQMQMQLAKSGLIEEPEMPKFDEKDLPSMDYEGFNYDDLADLDPSPAAPMQQPVKEQLPWEGEDRFQQESDPKPVQKPVAKPVAVATPDYSDAYDSYLPPYPTEEDDASWGMY